MYREDDEGVLCVWVGFSLFLALGYPCMFARRWMPTRVSDAASYMFAPDSVGAHVCIQHSSQDLSTGILYEILRGQ